MALLYKAKFTKPCSLTSQLAQNTSTRFDVCFFSAILAQMNREIGTSHKLVHIKKIRLILSQVEENSNFTSRFPKLYNNSWQRQVKANNLYVPNNDKVHELTCLIVSFDEQHTCLTGQ